MDGLLSLECDCVIEDLVDFLSVLPLKFGVPLLLGWPMM